MFLSNRTIIIMTVVSLTVLTIAAVQDRYAFCVQYDKSVHFTLGLLDRYDRTPQKGGYYVFMFYAAPNSQRYGEQFVKKVACVEGEHLKNVGREFFCNGEYIGTAKEKDKKGNKAPLYSYDGIIEKGKFFAVGEMIDSYDSKYWGFVDNSWLIGKVIKLF